MRPYWAGEASRQIMKRIVVEGNLVLLTPAHFGNGDSDELTDMPLLVDPVDRKTPLITGASLAGAMRSYLRERQHGYASVIDPKDPAQAALKASSAANLLFGGLKQDDDGEQSPLIIDDAYGSNFGVELRDGVALDSASRTAADKTKFDLQLWQAGTTFPLRFELAIRGGDHPDDEMALREALASALAGFGDSSITLGARKRRGYGRVAVEQWRVEEFELYKAPGLRAWLLHGGEKLTGQLWNAKQLPQALNALRLIPDARHVFELQADFILDSSLLIRSGGQGEEPDMVHLYARQSDRTHQPVLSGTSLGGALRARARKIANTLDNDVGYAKATNLVNKIFGQTSHASRLEVSEQVIKSGTTNLVQNRVSIDRFTGGSREGALFNQQPVFGNPDTTVRAHCKLRNPDNAEIGLLLHILKDLWTSDLTLGGESSVGRGRLKGQSATLRLRQHDTALNWTITTINGGLAVTGTMEKAGAVVSQAQAEAQAALETFATAFWEQMRE